MALFPKVRGKIVEVYGTQIKFAEALNVAPLTVSRKLNGETLFTREEMLLWADMLNIPVDEIGSYFFNKEVEGVQL